MVLWSCHNDVSIKNRLGPGVEWPDTLGFNFGTNSVNNTHHTRSQVDFCLRLRIIYYFEMSILYNQIQRQANHMLIITGSKDSVIISKYGAVKFAKSGVCSFQWNLAVFHRAGFHTFIVILWEKQSRRTRICTLTSKTSTPQASLFSGEKKYSCLLSAPKC